jgi:hypothetical protein
MEVHLEDCDLQHFVLLRIDARSFNIEHEHFVWNPGRHKSLKIANACRICKV